MRAFVVGLLIGTFLTSEVWAEEFTAPAGHLGAGLDNGETTKVRLYVDTTSYFRTGNDELFGTEYRATEWAFPFVLGGGYKLMPELELEGRIATAIGRRSIKVNDCPDGVDCDDAAGALTIGNLYVGANYMIEKDLWFVKVGGGIAYGPWTQDPNDDRTIAYIYSALTRLEDFYMFLPETFSIVAPARIEYRFMPQLAFTADVNLVTYIPTSSGGEVEVGTVLAPGAGYILNDLIVGGRMPLFWLLTEDTAQFALEPFARYDFSNYFATGRFTLNLDDPYGFSFDENAIWGLHLGFGGTF